MRPLHPDTLTIHQIASWSHALARLLDQHDPDTPVPTCGDWSLADLIWHLTEVQHFWTHIIEHRPDGPENYEPPPRPAGNVALLTGLEDSSSLLENVLHDADPAATAWSWSDDHTVRFTIRRQIHEALVHCIDGLLAVGADVPDVPPRLAADGIDELVQVMLTGTPEWATFTPEGRTVEIRPVDVNDRWRMQPGQMEGNEPTSQRHVVLPGYERTPNEAATAVITGRAIDLLLWMWGRVGEESIELGAQVDAAAASRLRATLADVTG